MSEMPRYIYTANPSSEIPTLIQSIFISELLNPSRCLWIVAPWISDIPLINNAFNQYVSLEPKWSRKNVYLSDILVYLLEKGSEVRVGTRPNKHSRHFINTLQDKSTHVQDKLYIQTRQELHAKGLIGDRYYLSGSANFTANGIMFLEESVQFTTNPALVAENRIIFAEHWGGQV